MDAYIEESIESFHKRLQGLDDHLSDDQAICVGYANSQSETDHLPPAHWLARRIGRELHRLRREQGAGQVGPDAKVVVRIERQGAHSTEFGRPFHFKSATQST